MNPERRLRTIGNEISGGLRRFGQFVRTDLWHDPEEGGRLRLVGYQVLRVLLLTLSGLRDQMILLRASALCYSTLLAIVPVLAIAFSMMKGLGVHSQIEHLLINYLTAEQEELTSKIIEYITKTDFKALGAVGTGLLIVAVLSMLSNVERTFNDLWGVIHNRPIVRKISDYISVLLLGPLLMVISTAMITSVSSHSVVQALSRYEVFEQFFIIFNRIVPHAALWIAFTAMYILMPNTRVRFIPALLAGIICGSLWEGAFRTYTTLNIGVARYNTIYGTFAALPVFIIWLFISWLIVLIGAKMSYAIQNVRSHQQEFKSFTVGQEEYEEMAVHITLKTVEQFHGGREPLSVAEISKALSVPVRMVRDITAQLSADRIVQEIYGEEPRYQPARNPELITVLDVCKAMRKSGAKHQWRLSESEKYAVLDKVLDEARSCEAEHLGRRSMLDLLKEREGEGKA
jgi:membrane protein